MVGQDEAVFGDVACLSRWTLHGTWEGDVCGGEGRLPLVRPHVEEPGDFLLVCVICEHCHDAFVSEDHVAEGGPAVDVHGLCWWGVDVIENARVLEGCGVIAGVDEVFVSEEDGDHLETMFVEPAFDFGQVCFESACVQFVAARVAEHDCVVHIMRFALDTTDSIIQLGGDIEDLVACCVAVDVEGAVVGYDISNIAVLSIAELGVSVAFHVI